MLIVLGLFTRLLHRHAFNHRYSSNICRLKTTPRRASAASTAPSNKTPHSVIHGKCELDSHADTTVAGSNCIILNYTGKVCDVSPYRDDYAPVTGVPIVKAATAWQSPHTGQTYILVFNEALWMGDSLDHTLINPNQLRHYGTAVQDNPTSDKPLSIITEDGDFCMELMMAGTIIYMNTSTPSQKELQECPHIALTSPHPWNPHEITFPKAKYELQDIINDHRLISAARGSNRMDQDAIDDNDERSIFSLTDIHRRICSMKIWPAKKSPAKSLARNEDIDTGATDVPQPHTFSSSDRHTDISAEQLSERWGIGIKTARETLRKTTQRFLRSAVLPLSRRYRADMMFERKTLRGQWSTDTMDGRCKSLD